MNLPNKPGEVMLDGNRVPDSFDIAVTKNGNLKDTFGEGEIMGKDVREGSE